MASEVDQLCGSNTSFTAVRCFVPGAVRGECRSPKEVVRPRVRQQQIDKATSEVTLASCESTRNPEELPASIMSALMASVSTREIKQVHLLAKAVSLTA